MEMVGMQFLRLRRAAAHGEYLADKRSFRRDSGGGVGYSRRTERAISRRDFERAPKTMVIWDLNLGNYKLLLYYTGVILFYGSAFIVKSYTVLLQRIFAKKLLKKKE